jgi:membrane protein
MTDFFYKTVKFFKLLYQKSFDDDIFSHAAQVAFYFSFSLFPLLLVLVTIFGLVLESTHELKQELYQYLNQLMPPSVFQLVKNTIEEVIETSSGGKLTLGIFITIWSASSGLDSLRIALNSVYGLKETRAWWKTKILSIGLTLILIILSASVLGLVFYGWQLIQIGLNSMSMEVTSPFVLITIEWTSILLMMVLAGELIYNLLPCHIKLKWQWITPGSIVAIILWLILAGVFRLYLENFNNYNRTYGSLGAMIILMLWLYLTALVILIGGAINSIVSEISSEKPEKNTS